MKLNEGLAEKRGKRMAYRKFGAEDDFLLNAESAAGASVHPATDPRFTREELAIIDLAEKDGVWSLHGEGRLGRLMRWAFGIEIARPLANRRLESLRRLAVRAWRQRPIDRAALAEFVAAGFSRRQADILVQNVARRTRVEQWPKGLA
jgi:hypothetical protein